MTPSQIACLDAMDIDRWVLRDASRSTTAATSAAWTLITSAPSTPASWRVLAPLDDAGLEQVDQPTMHLLRNVLGAARLDVGDAVFSTVDETANPAVQGVVCLAFVGTHSLDGWTSLPTLSEMLRRPEAKRRTWEILQEVSALSAL